MTDLLATWGVQLTAVGSQSEAVAAMESAQAAGESFDLLICDYRLSEEANGADVGLRLRERFDKDLPLLLISGETGPDRLKQVQALGIAIIAKPVEATALRHIISLISRASETQLGAVDP